MLERWQRSTLCELAAGGDSDPVAAVVTDLGSSGPVAGSKMFLANLQPAERAVVGSVDEFFHSIGTPVPRFSIARSGENLSSKGAGTGDALASLDLDFMLYLGFGPSDAGCARFAKHGLWRFRFGESSKYANYPPGVWEIIAGDPVTAAVLCTQSSEGSRARVLRSGAYATIMHQPRANADQVLAEVARWPAYVARSIRAELLDNEGDSIELGRTGQTGPPTTGVRIRLAWSSMKHKVARVPNLFYEDCWNVGIVEEPIHCFLRPNESRRVTWFPNRGRRYYFADPMGVIVEHKRLVLCETYDYESQLGSISALGIDDKGWIPSVDLAIAPAVHASYPYLFLYDGDVYCVPETSQAGEASLFKMTKFPNGFQTVKPFLEGVACIDPTIFQYDTYWWLFCTDVNDGEHSKLLVWYAKDILGDFMPHPLNPVKIDVRSARPAGTPFVHEGRLFRPSQDCSRTYGGAVTINEVLQLSPTRFREQPVATVEPIPGSGYSHGLHTLSSVGDVTLIDSKRRRFTGRGLREKVDAVLARTRRQ